MSGSSYRADSRPCDASCRRLLGQLDREWPSFLPSFFSRQSVRDCSTTSKGISLWQNGSRSARKDSVSLPHRVHPRHRCHVSRREVLLRQSRPAHQLPLVRVVVLPVGRPRLVARRGLLGRRLATGPASALGGSVCDETRGGAKAVHWSRAGERDAVENRCSTRAEDSATRIGRCADRSKRAAGEVAEFGRHQFAPSPFGPEKNTTRETHNDKRSNVKHSFASSVGGNTRVFYGCRLESSPAMHPIEGRRPAASSRVSSPRDTALDSY